MKALLLALILLLPVPVLAQSRVKDIAAVQDLGEASVVGYGVVTGLPGTGDSALVGRVPAEPGVRIGRNTASVMVTARLAPGLRPGSRADVTVSAMGDARSLTGGTLAPTALEGGDRRVYAVAEGPVATGGLSVEAGGQRLSRGSATTGTVSGGAMVEHELPLSLGQGGAVRFVLRNPDFTTAKRMADSINAALGRPLARARDNAAVSVQIPADMPDGAVGLIAAVEGVVVQPDRPAARIVVDARTGIIVAGQDIPLASAAISHGALSVRVTEAPQVSQPPPFSSGGSTVVVPRSTVEVDEGNGQLIALPPGSTVGDLLHRLRAAGMGPIDQISVLQSLRAAGGLNAELISR